MSAFPSIPGSPPLTSTPIQQPAQTPSGVRPTVPATDQVTISPQAARVAEMSSKALAMHQEGASNEEIARRLSMTDGEVQTALVVPPIG